MSFVYVGMEPEELTHDLELYDYIYSGYPPKENVTYNFTCKKCGTHARTFVNHKNEVLITCKYKSCEEAIMQRVLE